MDRSHRLSWAFAVLFLSASQSVGATATYTSQATFLANTSSTYFEQFSTAVNQQMTLPTFGPVNGFSYTISSTIGGDIYNSPNVGGGFITNADIGDFHLRVTFTGAPVTAVGGNFFATDQSVAFMAGSVIASLADGTQLTVTSASESALGFAGFTSDVAITSLSVFGNSGLGTYASLDNLYVGSASPVGAPVVPVPLAAFAGAGLLGLMGVGRRR